MPEYHQRKHYPAGMPLEHDAQGSCIFPRTPLSLPPDLVAVPLHSQCLLEAGRAPDMRKAGRAAGMCVSGRADGMWVSGRVAGEWEAGRAVLLVEASKHQCYFAE